MTASEKTETAPNFRALLEAERLELTARLDELGFGGTELTYDTNFADSSQVTAERGEADRLALELQEALDLVDAALAKIDNGTYGTCESCGSQIGEARLEAKPSAKFCITCAGSHR
ncbi:MAG: TraR/DksA family transcriptional regulator [Acidimicrobiales bacterium]|nr:TraR/DksA family transcriptional regulator [Acidimicrobiales bacterium]